MNTDPRTTWLVAYDIRQPRRLRRTHKILKAEGMAVQYSAFVVEAADEQLQRLLGRIRQIIDSAADDVRAYHLPSNCQVWRLGRQAMPDGVYLDASAAASELLGCVGATERAPADEAEPEAA